MRFGVFLLLSWAGLAVAGPLSPDDESASFRLADESLIVELAAAEPDVISPVAITWDAQGRMFVAEMLDYPVGPTAGQIRMLEDRNRDGRYETSAVFAVRLPFPNGVLPWNGGLLVTAAPDILFLKDTNGDGRADERRAILTGFAEGNQQLRVNGLMWGLDGWVYGANGRSDGEIRRPGETRSISLRGHDFRFRPDTGQFEAIGGRSQFGLARDDWGNRFLSWNTIAIRHEVIPARYLARHPRLSSVDGIQDLTPANDTGEVFPLTRAPQTFNQESTSHFNALAGLTIFRGDALDYRGNAFVGETLRNLVHRRVLEPAGATFSAKRVEQKTEFLASTDPWFHPVNFATGPDGALYIVDFYREWVEHPGYVPEKMRDHIPWRTGAEHGRIWRVRPRNAKIVFPGSRLDLSRASAGELARYLEHPNGWWRDTAQRLLVEKNETKAVRPVRDIALRSKRPEARVQALHTLRSLKALDSDVLRRALGDPHPRIREAAVQFSEPSEILGKATELVDDADDRVRLQVALSIGEADEPLRIPTLAKLAARSDSERMMMLAIRSSAARHPWPLLEKLLAQVSPAAERLELVRLLASDVGHSKVERDARSLLAAMPGARSPDALALFAGFTSGLASVDNSWRDRVRAWTPDHDRVISQLVTSAEQVVSASNAQPVSQQAALIALARANTPESTASLLNLLMPPNREGVQSATVTALAEAGEIPLLKEAFARWERLQISTRRKLLTVAVRSSAQSGALVEAIEQGTVRTAELDAAVRQTLAQSKNSELRTRIQRLLDPPSDRKAVIEKFSPALQLAGDAKRGARHFARLCLQCHAIQGSGHAIGPDLSAIASRSGEALLIDILDPSRQIPSDFISYTVTTSNGESIDGLIISENSGGLTVRRAGIPDQTIPRREVREIGASGQSLMPDGLEVDLTLSDFADILEFLRRADAKLLPEATATTR